MLTKELLESQNLVGKKTNAVFDPAFTKALKQVPWAEWLEKSPPFDCRKEYLQTLHEWIQASRLNSVRGLERFSERDLTIGTTQSFDEFYYRYADRRLRFFRGEYAYHRRIVKTWSFLEDAPLSDRDYLIISWPFCSTGAKHPRMDEILHQARQLRIPVLIDGAYFGTCQGLDFDFAHPAIEAVCFSISKSLGLGDIRSGIRYSFYTDDLPIRQQNRFNHTILADAKIGLYMMEKFSADYIPMQYREAQESVCREARLSPTPCMHLALGEESIWSDYKIDETYNRVGIRELVKARKKNKI